MATFDLNIFLDQASIREGWVLRSARAINDSGRIVGTSYNATIDTVHAFLLVRLADKEQCNDGGWQSFGFPNQGQCIKFVNTGE
jgi:probable HAF family extracellular repeat protein